MNDNLKDFSVLENKLGYEFSDKSLLKNALTHSSYASEHKMGYTANNERLEFMGDAYLDAVVAAEFFRIMENSHEGTLSKLRAEVVCEASLADAAKKISLGDYLYLGKGENLSGGRSKPSILSDAFEAVLGAVYLDGGYEKCRDITLMLLGDKIELAAKGKLNRDFKTALQEKIQENNNNSHIEYRTIGEEGPDHNKIFTVEVLLDGKVLGSGRGSSKSRAEQAAAENALKKGV